MIPLTIWLAACLQAVAAEVSTSQPVLTTRVGTVGQAAEILRHWAETSEARMAVHPNPAAAELAATMESARAALARQRAEVERLQRELEELRAAQQAAQEAETDLDKKIAEWQARLTRAETELQRLAVREAELRRQLDEQNNRGEGFSAGRSSGTLEQLDLMVIKGNLVAPTEAPYFTFTRIRYVQSGDTGLKMEQKQSGLPLGRALEEGGWLDKLLAKSDPKKHYLTIFVAEDSIPTYYALRAELRKRDIRHVWQAWDGSAIQTRARSTNSGSTGGIETY